MRPDLEFNLNGQSCRASVGAHSLLLDLLRDEFKLNGPKYGCGMAQCGACTVLVDGAPARACVLRAARIAGRSVTTLEGLADPVSGRLHPVQQGFVDAQGAQCGYCLNGMVMTAVAFLAQNPDPTETDIRQALRDNLCRCGTHQEIVASVARAAVLMAGGRND
ncbi:(2Fe-2S)-binding protein [Paracoccus shanxieyensis]|uniref:2Fe-2S iron-sulfur cluster binding domain-containing protein n=1 Tax=Paracoccus shanxieyensis TaxID=2675752 RepID=A0A6L6IZT5_9RHOB|nr:2Fe-2S iron-sulfur cluster binding domain-containing protein [Paracoccus shanxieyensis]MTH86875.1 2Fe-2S iron-sulfur cluster binding domain-containing protein [Paracoccus shanxieyensis]